MSTQVTPELREITVQILLEGDFDSSYNAGDNRKVLPTDTMKNTVYALAKREGLTSIEGFGKALSVHLLSNNAQIERARIRIAEDLWSRVEVNGAPHGSTFAVRSRLCGSQSTKPQGCRRSGRSTPV